MVGSRVTLVTGGAAGIGLATARRFAAAGDHVVIADVVEEAAKDATTSINESGGKASCYRLDVTEEAQVTDVVETVESAEGPIDALVTCAGILQNPGGIEDMTVEEHDRMWQINYRGVYVTCRAVRPAHERARAWGDRQYALDHVDPALSAGRLRGGKSSLKMLTDVLAAEFGPHGVRVNGVAPGVTMTENMKRRVAAGERGSGEDR